MRISRGAALPLGSAALFGASTPFSKLLVGEIAPVLLAGLLYLGSGAGLGLNTSRSPTPIRTIPTSTTASALNLRECQLAVFRGGTLTRHPAHSAEAV